MLNTHRPSLIDQTTQLENLRICVIASTYPRHEADYAVPWLRESIAHLVDRGHKVTVLAPSYEGLADHLIDGVKVVRFRYWLKPWERLTHEQGAPNRIRNPFYQLQAVPYVLQGCRAARKLARCSPFDIIHVHWPFPHEPIGSAAAAQCNAPLIMTSHGAEFALARRKPWVSVCLRRSLLKADELIANSSDTAHHIHQLCGRSAEVIPFGSTVHPKASSTTVRNKGLPRVLFTGRLIQRKGVEYLLHAAKQIVRKQSVQFVITGDGDQRYQLEELSRELGVDRHVQFLGFVSNEELNEEYARCDLWVNPSIIDDNGDTEGLGVGAVEAYAHGKPVVASSVGGIPDVVIDHQTGLLVPQKNPHALAKAILELLNDRARSDRFAAAGLLHVSKRFNWSTITNQLEAIYWRSLLHRGDAIERASVLPPSDTTSADPSTAAHEFSRPMAGAVSIPLDEYGPSPQEVRGC